MANRTNDAILPNILSLDYPPYLYVLVHGLPLPHEENNHIDNLLFVVT